MKIISFEDVKSLNISPSDCYLWVEDMIKNKKAAQLPAKTHMNMPGNIFCNVMPSLVPGISGAVCLQVRSVLRYGRDHRQPGTGLYRRCEERPRQIPEKTVPRRADDPPHAGQPVTDPPPAAGG